MLNIFLNFDFYGAGNIGDDLMLDGFLKGMKDIKAEYYCCLPRDFYHQKIRFPEINFKGKHERRKTADECSVWAGVGDTPVQIKSGSWFLEKLKRDNEVVKNKNIKYYFIGTGAEKEALKQKDEFSEALENVDHFWTRDRSTTDILKNSFNIKEDKITTGSDLANISLNNIFPENELIERRKFKTGICYYDEDMREDYLEIIKSFLISLKKIETVIIFGNEVKRDSQNEYQFYMRMFSFFERKFTVRIKYYQPEYLDTRNVSDLVKHYSDIETVFSSRYHSLLTAAWAGCRAVALERSSKISALAEELGIEEVKKPFTLEKLHNAKKRACKVDRKILNNILSKANIITEEFRKKLILN